MTTVVQPPREAGRDTTTPRPTRGRFRFERLVLPGLLLMVALVQGINITGWPALGADEGTYLAQAWAVAEGRGLAHYTYWYDHPPAAWLQLAALHWLPGLLLPDETVVAAGRVLMLLVSLANAALVYVLTRRLAFPRWTAALAVALFTLSPLSVALHRQVYLDAIAVGWVLGAMVLALSPRKHLWHHAAAGMCMAVACLSKETMVLALPAVVLAVWRGTCPSTRKFCLVGFSSTLVLTGGLYPLYALLKGELFPGQGHVSLLGALGFQLTGRTGSGSVFTPGSDASKIVDSWLYQDAVLILAGVAAVLLAFAVRRLRIPALAGGVMILMGLRPGGYVPAMYIEQILPFLAICLAGVIAVGADRLLNQPWRLGRGRLPLRWEHPVRVALVTVLALAACAAVVPRWAVADHQAMTRRMNTDLAAAVRWVGETVPDKANTRIVVDDALWLDMVDQGFDPGLGVIWFYKLDLDPAVMRHLPRGWRDLDYIVSSPIMRNSPDELPTLRDAMKNSDVAATFGTGDDRVEIRRVHTTGGS